jgi:hypothetical protein
MRKLDTDRDALRESVLARRELALGTCQAGWNISLRDGSVLQSAAIAVQQETPPQEDILTETLAKRYAAIQL